MLKPFALWLLLITALLVVMFDTNNPAGHAVYAILQPIIQLHHILKGASNA